MFASAALAVMLNLMCYSALTVTGEIRFYGESTDLMILPVKPSETEKQPARNSDLTPKKVADCFLERWTGLRAFIFLTLMKATLF